MWISFTCENLRALRFKSSSVFLKGPQVTPNKRPSIFFASVVLLQWWWSILCILPDQPNMFYRSFSNIAFRHKVAILVFTATRMNMEIHLYAMCFIFVKYCGLSVLQSKHIQIKQVDDICIAFWSFLCNHVLRSSIDVHTMRPVRRICACNSVELSPIVKPIR